MAYAQWVQVSIKPINFDAKIGDLKVSWGKLYDKGNKDKELKVSEVNEKAITSGQTFEIYACGRSDSASGTEGSFSLYNGNVQVAKFYWDCPWGSKTNTFNHEKIQGDEYMLEISDYNHYSGALGQVTIKVAKF